MYAYSKARVCSTQHACTRVCISKITRECSHSIWTPRVSHACHTRGPFKLWVICTVHAHTHTHKHACMRVHTQTHMHACAHTNIHTHACTVCTHTHNCKHTHIYTHACMHAHTYKHTHINILRRCCLEDVATHNAEDTEISNTPT